MQTKNRKNPFFFKIICCADNTPKTVPAGKFGWRPQPSTKKALRCALRFGCWASLPALSSLEPKRNLPDGSQDSPAGGQDLISLPVLSSQKQKKTRENAKYNAYQAEINLWIVNSPYEMVFNERPFD